MSGTKVARVRLDSHVEQCTVNSVLRVPFHECSLVVALNNTLNWVAGPVYTRNTFVAVKPHLLGFEDVSKHAVPRLLD